MFENKQLKELFKTDLDSFFNTRLDEIFNYKRVAPITYKKRVWEKYQYQIEELGEVCNLVTDPNEWKYQDYLYWERVDENNSFYLKSPISEDNGPRVLGKTDLTKITSIEFYYKTTLNNNGNSDNSFWIYIADSNGNTISNFSSYETINDWQYYKKTFDNPTDLSYLFIYVDKESGAGADSIGYVKDFKVCDQEMVAKSIKEFNFKILNGFKNKYHIKNYENNKNNSKFRITTLYKNNSNNFKFRITPYKNKLNNVFYRLGYINPAPKRIIIKDLDDN
jgi:hypothetical protein